MKIDKQIFKKPSFYVFATSVALCLAMFIYAIVALACFSNGVADARFANIVQIIFSIACLLILCIYFAYVHFTKISISQALHIYFMAFILVFLGAFPCFELFATKAGLGVFFAFTGFTVAVISISVFFHFSKSQNGTLRANPWFMAIFELGTSTLVVSLVATIASLVSKANGTGILQTTNSILSQLGYAWIGMGVAAVLSVVSLLYSKYFVNTCLIKTNK